MYLQVCIVTRSHVHVYEHVNFLIWYYEQIESIQVGVASSYEMIDIMDDMKRGTFDMIIIKFDQMIIN